MKWPLSSLNHPLPYALNRNGPVHFHILDRPVQSEPETQTKNVSAFLLPLSGRYASSRLPVQSFQNHSVSVQTLNPEPCNTWLVRVCRNPCLATG